MKLDIVRVLRIRFALRGLGKSMILCAIAVNEADIVY